MLSNFVTHKSFLQKIGLKESQRSGRNANQFIAANESVQYLVGSKTFSLTTVIHWGFGTRELFKIEHNKNLNTENQRNTMRIACSKMMISSFNNNGIMFII